MNKLGIFQLEIFSKHQRSTQSFDKRIVSRIVSRKALQGSHVECRINAVIGADIACILAHNRYRGAFWDGERENESAILNLDRASLVLSCSR